MNLFSTVRLPYRLGSLATHDSRALDHCAAGESSYLKKWKVSLQSILRKYPERTIYWFRHNRQRDKIIALNSSKTDYILRTHQATTCTAPREKKTGLVLRTVTRATQDLSIADISCMQCNLTANKDHADSSADWWSSEEAQHYKSENRIKFVG